MSFCDKMSSGIMVAVIQGFHRYLSLAAFNIFLDINKCLSYYESPVGFAKMAALFFTPKCSFTA